MCTNPNYMVWTGRTWSSSGKPRFSFMPHGNYDYIKKSGMPFIEVPCGKCLECQITYGKQWADRCYLESLNSPYNYFVTLTYDDDHLPQDHSLHREDLTNFMKRLRKHYGPCVRFFACGEYGESSLRPHFHIMLFNCQIDDLTYLAEIKGDDGRYHPHIIEGNSSGNMYSRTIYDLWHNQGIITVSPFHYSRAAYIAQYCTKKLTKKESLKELHLAPEFITMSRRPGLAANQYKDEYVTDDYIVICNGKYGDTSQLPRYFEKLFIKKYGEEVFQDTVYDQRIKNRIQSRTDYDHSRKIKSRGNAIRNYRLTKQKKLRDAV